MGPLYLTCFLSSRTLVHETTCSPNSPGGAAPLPHPSRNFLQPQSTPVSCKGPSWACPLGVLMPPSAPSLVCTAPQSGSCCAGVFLQRSDGSSCVPYLTQLDWTGPPVTHESTFVALCVAGSPLLMDQEVECFCLKWAHSSLFQALIVLPFIGTCQHMSSGHRFVVDPSGRVTDLPSPMKRCSGHSFLLDVRSYLVHGNKTLGVF